MQALTIKAKEARDWVLAAANRLSKVEEHAKVRPPTVDWCASSVLTQGQTAECLTGPGVCLVLISGSYVACMQGLSKKGQIHKRAATRLLELCKDHKTDEHPFH